ncbi:hypothetical protein AAKU55_004226 [Oxalobacteraceae bacterium GrIS 1.11]
MQTLLKITSGILCAGLTLASNAASAGVHVNAGASVSDIQFNVVDLTPGDGQAAGFVSRFDFGFMGSSIETPAPANDLKNQEHFDRGPFTTHVSDDFSDTSASVDGVWGAGTTQLQVDAQRGQPRAVNSFSGSLFDLAIQPHTALSISGHAAGWANKSGGYTSPEFTAFGNVYVSLTNNFAPPYGLLTLFTKTASINRLANEPGFSDDFLLFYSNTSDSVQSVKLNVSWGTGANALSAVPEPASYAMLGAGLLLLGAIRRKA